jgi:hypothetical protein
MVKVVFKNPLFSIIPIPTRIIINILNGVNDVKLDTVEVKMYLIPLRLNSGITLSETVLYSPVTVSI